MWTRLFPCFIIRLYIYLYGTTASSTILRGSSDMELRTVDENNIDEYSHIVDMDVAENIGRVYYHGLAGHDPYDDNILSLLIWELKNKEKHHSFELTLFLQMCVTTLIMVIFSAAFDIAPVFWKVNENNIAVFMMIRFVVAFLVDQIFAVNILARTGKKQGHPDGCGL